MIRPDCAYVVPTTTSSEINVFKPGRKMRESSSLRFSRFKIIFLLNLDRRFRSYLNLIQVDLSLSIIARIVHVM